MASYQRIALFIIFDSLERDIIALVRKEIRQDKVLTEDERDKARKNIIKRARGDLYNTQDDFDLLHGLDLGEKFQILLRYRSQFPSELGSYLVALQPKFEKVIPIRNDTMHGRPLTVDDYMVGFSFANDLIKSSATWVELASSIRAFNENPSGLVQQAIAFIEEESASETLNNLPLVDYDDTGFVPRPRLEAELKKKILGRHPVITVQGDGGNGKSALALQTAYRLLRSSDHNFDAIIWVSAKTSALTVGEVSRIEGAITNSLGLFEAVATFEPGEGDPLDRVERLLAENKILLFIDNLETVIDKRIKSFAESVPGESKIVFTSRVPLGSDLIVPVDEFTENEALIFLRRLIDAYAIGRLQRTSNADLKRYIRRLSSKPLLIKWFARGVLSGLSPEAIVSNTETALQFCLENVVNTLDSPSQSTALAFALLPGPHSAVAIQYVTKLPATQIEGAIATLLRYGLLEDSSKTTQERTYTMRSFPRAYLTRLGPSRKEFRDSVLARFKALEGHFQIQSANYVSNPYDARRFTVRSRSEAVLTSRLRQAIVAADRDNFDLADSLIEECRVIAPEYFEVYRTAAFVAVRRGDYADARQLYEAAIEIADKQPQLHFWFGGFLMRFENAYSAAAEEFAKARELDPHSSAVLREWARSQLFASNFDEAQRLINLATVLENKSFKDDIIFADLRCQVFARKAESLGRMGDFEGCIEELETLKAMVLELDRSLIDSTLVQHLQKSQPTAEVLIARAPPSVALRADAYLKWLFQWDNPAPPADHSSLEEGAPTHEGVLKTAGRKPNYGFIACNNGHEDVFVHRSSVTSEIWSMLVRGERVMFNILQQPDGKTCATNVQLA